MQLTIPKPYLSTGIASDPTAWILFFELYSVPKTSLNLLKYSFFSFSFSFLCCISKLSSIRKYLYPFLGSGYFYYCYYYYYSRLTYCFSTTYSLILSYYTSVRSKVKYASPVRHNLTTTDAGEHKWTFAALCFCRLLPFTPYNCFLVLEPLNLHNLQFRGYHIDTLYFDHGL